MGRMAIVDAVVGIVIALVCYLLGFFHGRSNVRAKVEQAVEEGAVSLDAREFTMRQQLDEAIAEVARLRPLAEELGRVQERLRREQAEYDHLKADFNATLKGDSGDESGEAVPDPSQNETPAPETADEAIQRLLKSLEVTMKEPGEQVQPPAEQPPAVEARAVIVAEQPPIVSNAPVASAPPKAQQLPAVSQVPATSGPTKAITEEPKKVSSVPQATQPKPPVEDEWQEFARSLADLTRRKQ